MEDMERDPEVEREREGERERRGGEGRVYNNEPLSLTKDSHHFPN
jgi:hypothetical protein